jgi:delta24-sterol reductase
MSTTHEALVRRIGDEIRARPASKRLTIRKRHPGHTPHDLRYKDNCHPVHVDGLDRILGIDRERRVATVEGQVTLGQLCRESAAVGLMPKVVPEFETFTIAGLVNGLGIESSSHRHGVFPATAVRHEVVLGNGEALEIDRDHHADLFATLPGSYGTLGVVTKVELELVAAKPFIRSRYRRFSQLADYAAAFRQALPEHEFVEGFVLGTRDFVLVTSDYSELVAGLPVFEAMTPGLPWYYQHAAEVGDGEDLLPTYEYMFRHQRGLGWMAGIIADLKVFTHTRWGRAYLDREVDRKVRETGFTAHMPIELAQRSLISQDMGMRLSRLEEGIEYVQRNFAIYPLWNCPADAGTSEIGFATPRKMAANPELVVDIGIYGEPRVRGFRFYDALHALQRFVDVPTLWGVSYLTPAELREIYDFATYEAVQTKYHAAGAFVPLESKIHFMRPSENQAAVPLWRLVNLWYDLRAKRNGSPATR